MSDSLATPGFGTQLKRDGTAIAEVKNITGPGITLGQVEVTNQSSEDGWREYIGTLLDGGEVSFDANFLPADATQSFGAGLISDMVGRLLQDFSIVFTNIAATTWAFKALVTKFTPSAPVDGNLSAAVTLKLSGKPTLA